MDTVFPLEIMELVEIYTRGLGAKVRVGVDNSHHFQAGPLGKVSQVSIP